MMSGNDDQAQDAWDDQPHETNRDDHERIHADLMQKNDHYDCDWERVKNTNIPCTR